GGSARSPLTGNSMSPPSSNDCARRSLILLLRHWRAELTIESVIGLFAGDFQLPMCKIFGDVAAIAPALKHENVFGSGSDSGLKNARPVNLALKTPFFIKQRLGVPGFCQLTVNVGLESHHLCWQTQIECAGFIPVAKRQLPNVTDK